MNDILNLTVIEFIDKHSGLRKITKYYSYTDCIGERAIKKEIYVNEDKVLHRDNDLPAYTKYNKDGIIIEQKWYQNGQLHRDYDQPAHITYKDAIISKWYQNGKLHRFDNPAIISLKNGKIFFEEWHQFGLINRNNDEPAFIWYDSDCNLENQTWYINDIKYRKDGKPCYIQYHNDIIEGHNISTIISKEWTDKNGEYIKGLDKPFRISFHDNGSIHTEDFISNLDIVITKKYREDGKIKSITKNGEIRTRTKYFEDGITIRSIDCIIGSDLVRIRFNNNGSIYSKTWFNQYSDSQKNKKYY